MTRFVQFHVLTPYPVSNPNRDDLGLPKMGMIGGTLRARASSQNFKYTIRISPEMVALGADHRGIRTKQVGTLITNYLAKQEIEPAEATRVAKAIIGVLENKKKEKEEKAKPAKGKKAAAADQAAEASLEASSDVSDAATGLEMGQLVFLSPAEIGQITSAALDVVRGGPLPTYTDLLLEADSAVDIAMSGRMMAATPEFNREAAMQVSHAITTHKVVIEDDYFSATDDLKTRFNSGAAHIGQRAFISGIFYRYVVVDFDLLTRNLKGNADLATASLVALIRALVSASSPGMQASYASRTRAAYVMVEHGTDQPYTGATAFDEAVVGANLLDLSIERLRQHRAAMRRRYCLGDTSFEFAPDNDATIDDLAAFVAAGVR